MASKKSTKPNKELRVAIVCHGGTQRALARRLGMDETRLSRIVRGQAQPFPHERRALAKVLKCHEAAIFRPRVAA